MAIIHPSVLSWGRPIDYPTGSRSPRRNSRCWNSGRKFPPGSIQNQHFRDPWGPTFFLPRKVNGTHRARQSILEAFHFFFLSFPRAIIKPIEVWGFFSSPSSWSDTFTAPATGSSALRMLGC